MSMSDNNHFRPNKNTGSREKEKIDQEMQFHYKEYQRKTAFRKKAIKTAALLAIPVVIILSLVLMNTSCQHSEKTTGETSAAAETASAIASEGSEISMPDDFSTVSEASEESSEESSESSMPAYQNPHQYKINEGRFSDETVYELTQNITSEFVALYDVSTDEVLYTQSYDKKCYPASTTKLLTAITASSIITDPKTVITVGDEIRLIGEDSSIAYLEEGMQLTFEMLMDALLLPSGNDAAYTMAVNCARIYKNDPTLSNEDAVGIFMELVNHAAKEIGAVHTHYVTPDGWHDDDHYTSAQDLVIIGDYARTIPIVKNSCAKAYVEWDLIKGGSIAWMNSNKLIQWDSGVYSEYCDGLKTGFTDQAGTSVVASATMEGHTLIAVVMNGLNLYSKYEDCNRLFHAGFSLYDLNYTYG